MPRCRDARACGNLLYCPHIFAGFSPLPSSPYLSAEGRPCPPGPATIAGLSVRRSSEYTISSIRHLLFKFSVLMYERKYICTSFSNCYILKEILLCRIQNRVMNTNTFSNEPKHSHVLLGLLLPFFEFVIGGTLLAFLVFHIQQQDLKTQQHDADVNCMTYADRIMSDLQADLSITDTLEQIIISEDGNCTAFHEVAANLANDSIESILLAPSGILSQQYLNEGALPVSEATVETAENASEETTPVPAAAMSAEQSPAEEEPALDEGATEDLAEEQRNHYAVYARKHDLTTLEGPLTLADGRQVLVARNPIFLNRNGQRTFWGYTIVVIRIPEVFSASLRSLDYFGYQYRLLKTNAPWDQETLECAHSGRELHDPVSHWFSIGGIRWELQLMPDSAWAPDALSSFVRWTGIIILLLVTGLSYALFVLHGHQKHLSRISETDTLTGIYNLNGFQKQLTLHLRRHTDSSCILAELDIDNFKFINDLYGHPAGDVALQCLAQSLREYFSTDVIIGRNGGDEFCIFLPGKTRESARTLLHTFCKTPQEFLYKGQKHRFTISMGYAEYPAQARSQEQLVRLADAALYEVKLRGKNGCKSYETDIKEIRTQLGFALNDISANLPCAFLIYRADPENDELLFANHEMLDLTGCQTMEEFFDYTGRRFRALVSAPEYTEVEASIWKQINADGADNNDYVRFSLIRRDGSMISVLDHGRIVENSLYGRVFYVIFTDEEKYMRNYQSKA